MNGINFEELYIIWNKIIFPSSYHDNGLINGNFCLHRNKNKGSVFFLNYNFELSDIGIAFAQRWIFFWEG